ncbi:tetratricopeptide repeat protein [Halomonas denitrificans]|nr:tetratricopeptide repeat protein [Halomonas denitrificans]
MTTRALSAASIGALLSLALLLVGAGASAQEAGGAESVETMDRLPLAALLIGDGNYQRARTVLSAVDPDAEDLDRVRYYTLSGLVALNLEEHALAVREFRAAIEAGQSEPVVWLYLAQAHFSQEEFAEALDALDRAGPEATDLPSVFLMRAQAHWQLEQYDAAWSVLADGRSRFPDRAGDFARRQVFLLVDRGLYQEAADQGRAFLETERAGIEDAIAIGNALRQSGQHDEAAGILEAARVEAPDNVTLAKVLSHTYLDQDMTLAAAEVMRQAAAFDSSLVSEAAELYRRAGWLMEALTLNAQVIDQAKKFKQRLAIFIELGRFDQAAGMRDDLERVGLLDDPQQGQDIRYALAYANFKAGDFAAAEDQLVTLERADLFRKATELRRVMDQCADEPWLCR